MLQFTFPLDTIQRFAAEFGINWHKDPGQSFEKAWENYCTQIITELERWCYSSNIRQFASGFTQIAIQITFAKKSDATLFKLRWHNA